MKISKNITTVFSFIIVIIILVLPFIFHKGNSDIGQNTQIATSTILFDRPMVIGKHVIDISIADTPAKREKGLSGTPPLGPKQGMLFVFDTPTRPYFWMKDMNYPLDMIWVDQDKKIVSVNENIDPRTFPFSFSPRVPIQYVLEVQAGFYKFNNLNVGDKILF